MRYIDWITWEIVDSKLRILNYRFTFGEYTTEFWSIIKID